MGLEDIVKNNHYPIIFIGSGIEKRYLKNFPTWNSLLKEYWDKVEKGKNFFSFLHELTEKHPENDIVTQDFNANIAAAKYIEEKFDSLFFSEALTVPGLSIQDAQENRISPFKQSVANRLRHYELREDIDEEEFTVFVKMLEKAKMIITTNYDTFLQDMITKDSNQKPHIYTGNSGLFDSNEGWSELYQIHGSVEKPDSIIIDQKDYDSFDKNSVLISAKILSSMIDTPIIFFGYSMKDRNIRKVLSDFGFQLTQEDPRKSSNRILVVDYKAEEQNLNEEIMNDITLNSLNYTLIKTDNYKEVFKELATINEGATPYEIRKFSGLIKKLIVQKGQAGCLESVLVTPTQLDDISKEIDQGKPIVVAMGDKKYFYVYPDTISYLKDYLANTNSYAPSIALSFVSRAGSRNTKIPFAKYWNTVDKESLTLSLKDLVKINRKIEEYGTLTKAKQFINTQYRQNFSSIKEIKSKNFSLNREIDTISWNLDKFKSTEIEQYLKSILPMFYETLAKNSTGITSSIRRLLVIKDLIENGDMDKIEIKQKN